MKPGPRAPKALLKNEAYCTGCGKPRTIIGADSPDGPQRTVDDRYVLVQCGAVKRPGVFDRLVARKVIRDRRARAKARKTARIQTYGSLYPEASRRLARVSPR